MDSIAFLDNFQWNQHENNEYEQLFVNSMKLSRKMVIVWNKPAQRLIGWNALNVMASILNPEKNARSWTMTVYSAK